MKNLFHHSLIKIIFLHHLNQLKIAWDTLIANHIFTTLKPRHAEDIPPPSQPTTSIPPSSLPISPPSSPFHDRGESPGRAKAIKPKREDLSTMAHTFLRGHRQVFSPQLLGGPLPSSSTKKV